MIKHLGKYVFCFMKNALLIGKAQLYQKNEAYNCLIFADNYFCFCSGFGCSGNKSAKRPPLPPPGCGGEWKETGRKLVGRDKGSLTEQQTKGTATTTIQIRRKQHEPHDPESGSPRQYRCRELPSHE